MSKRGMPVGMHSGWRQPACHHFTSLHWSHVPAGLTVSATDTRVLAGMPADRTMSCSLGWVATTGTWAALQSDRRAGQERTG